MRNFCEARTETDLKERNGHVGDLERGVTSESPGMRDLICWTVEIYTAQYH